MDDKIVGEGLGIGGRMRLPLFPLKTVLFPGGYILLHVFEPRYIDMVKLCLREEIGFGVCMIKEDSPDTEPASAIAACGTYAIIHDWEQLDNGLLGLHCHGEKRFRLHAEIKGPGGMRLGDIDWFPEKACQKRPQLLDMCVDYLISRIQNESSEKIEQSKHISDPHWVGYRLAEVLPLTLKSRQTLLEMNDAALRLKVLYAVIQTLGDTPLASN